MGIGLFIENGMFAVRADVVLDLRILKITIGVSSATTLLTNINNLETYITKQQHDALGAQFGGIQTSPSQSTRRQ